MNTHHDMTGCAFFSEKIMTPDNQVVAIQFSDKPSVESYEFLRSYADFKIAALKRKETVGE